MTRLMPFYEPAIGMRRFREEMGRLLESLGQEWPVLSASYPPLNVWQDDAKIYVEAEIPGMDLSDLEIYVTGGDQLVIKGERKPPQEENAAYHRQERAFGSFTRILTLPVMVNADQVEARLVNGVLQVALPKSETTKVKKIPIKAG